QISANAMETSTAAPFAAPTIASSPATVDAAGSLEAASISSLLPSGPAHRPLGDTILPLGSAQLPPTSKARTASALAEQTSARSLPSAAAEAVPIGDNASGALENVISADRLVRPGSIAPLDAAPETRPAAEAEV